jgi:uncharacterized membrane protein YbhN (UPF0104 family)
VSQAAGGGHHPQGDVRRRALKLVGYVVLAFLVIKLIPGLHQALRSLEHVRWQWLLVAVVLEVLSEACFVLSWRSIVDPDGVLGTGGPGRRTDRYAAWTQLGGGMLLPAGTLSSVGVGAWILRRFGMAPHTIAERQFNLSFLNTTIDALALIVFGLGLASGVFSGERNLLLTLVPAALAAVGLALALLVAHHAESLASRLRAKHAKTATAIDTLAAAVTDTKRLLSTRAGLPGVAGALGYLGFDVLMLWSAFTAIHTHPLPSFAVVLMGYIIGALGGSIPLPAAAGSVGGMVGMLILYGVGRDAAVAAVVLYQAVALLVPLIGGGVGYLLLHRTLAAAKPSPDAADAPSAVQGPSATPGLRQAR